MVEEPIEVVDDDDRVLRTVYWDELHTSALLHRSSAVLLFDSHGHLFVHRRSKALPLYPGLFDIKFGGIARVDESYEDCARRELMEEAGVKDVDLVFLGKVRYRRPECNSNQDVFRCVYDGPLRLQRSEISEGRFMERGEIDELVRDRRLSPSAMAAYERFVKHG